MESIGEPKIDFQKIQEILDIFEPDVNGKKIKKLQVKNGKLEYKYEDGE